MDTCCFLVGERISTLDPCVRIESTCIGAALSYLRENQAERMDSTKASSPHAARTAALGRAIRARRKALRLTQIDLSKLAGCGPDFVYDVEAGKTSLRLDKLLDVLGILGLELVVEQGKNGLRIAPPLAPGGGR
jgi:y4mF family transcriptional regulator